MKFLEEYIDWFTFPALFVVCVVWSPDLGLGAVWGAFAKLALMVIGFVLWTLAEYIIHRWVLHGFYWMGIHQRHHEHPLENTRFPLWQIPSYFAVIAVLTHLLAGSPWDVPIFAGIVAGYVMFFVMHWLEHHWPALVPQLAINHNAHHKLTTMNYGITVTWWDRVFGTYREPRGKA